jgi:hypothetical protein
VTFTHSADCHDPVCPEMHEDQRAPAIDRELLADAILVHRLGQYERLDALGSGHLCFEDCAEDIAAHYGKPVR